MRKIKVFIFLIFILSPELKAQVNDDYNALKSAYINIQEEKYDEAYLYFSEILKLYPKEPIYNYYVGRCLLYLEKDPSKAIHYLRFASTKEVPDDVYYYLGLAYIKTYQFDKALKNLQFFESRASKKQIKSMQLANYISIAQNALYLTKYIREPQVYSKTEYDTDHFHEYYTIEDLEGRFMDYFDFFDQRKDSLSENRLLFVPDRLGKNETLYFTQKNEKRDDYDIYSITRLSDTSWSEPENLGDVINTPFDEDYPYMHSDGKTLYFASKGHYSMGGYDLYKSTWNWRAQEWSEPENLDFPINSPYDDVLFVSSPNKKYALFASDRGTEKNKIMVYKLKLNSSDPYIELKNNNEIISYAQLDVNEKNDVSSDNDQSERYRTSQDDLVKIKDNEEFERKSEYDSLLNMAVTYQLKADSLRWLIDEKRQVFDETSDSDERAKLSNVIIELEMSIYALQKKSDACYSQVREIEQANLASQKTIYEEVKVVKEEDEYSDDKKSLNVFIEPIPDSLTISKLEVEEDLEQDTVPLIDLGLRIEGPSIYNAKNPIPMNEVMPEGILYMIQLGAFSSDKSVAVFKGLTPLSVIKKENSTIRKYFAGKFLQLSEAEKNLSIVKNKGFRDAYIVAFQNGKIIPVKNAVKLESKEIIMPATDLDEKKEESLSNELDIIFVIKGEVAINDSLIVDKIKTELPEEKELYVDESENSNQLIIKSFSNYDKAESIMKSITELGVKETEIHAYFAENQIPLSQARKITK